MQKVYLALRHVADEALALVLAFLLSLNVVSLVRLPFKDADNISNSFSILHFNPDNNFAQTIFMIGATVGLYLLLKYFSDSRRGYLYKAVVIALLLGNFFITYDVHYAQIIPQFDPFHVGEQISPTNDFLAGKKIFSEIYILHGAGQDVWLPAVGFALLGKSIGSYLLFNNFLILFVMLSFFILVGYLFKDPLVFTLISVCFTMSSAVSIGYIRDLPVWLTIGLLWMLFKAGLSQKARMIILFVIGLIAALELYLAIDRGVLLCGLAGLVTIATLIIKSDDNNKKLKLDLRAWRYNYPIALLVPVGVLVGLLLPVPFIGLGGFVEFLKMTFHDIPKDMGLLFGFPFPPLTLANYLVWSPIIIAITSMYLLIQLFRSSMPGKLRVLAPLTILMIFCVAFLKVGVGRPDPGHISYASTPLLLTTLLLWRAALGASKRPLLSPQTSVMIFSLFLSVVFVAAGSQLKPSHLFSVPQYTWSDLKNFKDIYKLPDNFWYMDDQTGVVSYIHEHTQPHDPIFTFTSDPIYYYLADRPNPSRYYISWFADATPKTQELLASLQRNRPKLIIYEDGTWHDTPDLVPMSQRLPEVNQWIKENYPKRTIIGNTTILEPSAREAQAVAN